MQTQILSAEVCALAPRLARRGTRLLTTVTLANRSDCSSVVHSGTERNWNWSESLWSVHIGQRNSIVGSLLPSAVRIKVCAPFLRAVPQRWFRKEERAKKVVGGAAAVGGWNRSHLTCQQGRKLTCHRGKLTCRLRREGCALGPGLGEGDDRFCLAVSSYRGIRGGLTATATATVAAGAAVVGIHHQYFPSVAGERAQRGKEQIYGCDFGRSAVFGGRSGLTSPVGICTVPCRGERPDYLEGRFLERTNTKGREGRCQRERVGEEGWIVSVVRKRLNTGREASSRAEGRGRRGFLKGEKLRNARPLVSALRSVGGVGIASCTVNMDATRCEDTGEAATTSLPYGLDTLLAGPLKSTEGRIVLTKLEERVFETLLETCKRFGLKTQLRVAGGWVRDKLLGKNSGDVDIALDDMMGKEFAEKVNEYLISMGVETSNIGVIQSNPEQSKHLETATTRVHGVGIDFVNLRAEKYAEDSRIPTVEFGTAEQDALRRDLTINSLFYNINTGCVEDFTGRGLDDLRSGIVRTPLNPVSTFLDDPLRVLRAIRFGARFGFVLDDELADAAARKEVRTALGSKISRERIGVEVQLMLKGPDPLTAMRAISRLGLFSAVFALPSDAESFIKFNYGSVCVACLEAVLDVLKQWPQDSFMADDRWICLLGGLLMPLREVTVVRKKKSTPVAAVLIREALKLRGKDSDMVATLHSSLPNIRSLTLLLLDSDEGVLKPDSDGSANTVVPSSGDALASSSGFSSLRARQRIAAGLAVRTLKELWRPALVLSAAAASAPVASTPLGREPTNGNSVKCKLDVDGDTKSLERGDNCTQQQRAVTAHAEVEALICGLGLDRAWEIKPLLDGSSVMRVLGMKGGGPLLGQAMGRIIEWQLVNPEGTADELKLWLQQQATSFAPVTKTTE